jgi:TonB-dependent SusC/RagA subfamily outer membrane receptor
MLALLLALVPAQRVEAQGQIVGQVVDQATLRPLGEVQVYIAGTGLGALTRADGRFLILNVPVGTHAITAERIGMRAATQQVTVAAGQSATVDFQLEAEALGLDELVVTGTAGAARRREVGTAVAQVNLADRPEPVVSVDQALAARAPGMTSLRSSGMAGSGSQIRLRGNVSIAMSNQPLIYVDGVRLRSDGYALNHAVGQHVAFGPKDVVGPLNDINPNDIERIEIVKGPAATALYGTEAAGGVIQIFTKRGSSGAATWSAQVDQGVNWVQPFGPDYEPYMRLDPWLRNGHQQRYSLSVRGGASNVTYFVSGGLEDNVGILPNDYEDKYLIRGNVGFRPFESLDLQWNTAITRQEISNSPSGSSPYSISHNGYKRSPADGRHATYVGTADEDVISRLLDYEIDSDISRIVTGFTATYTPMPRLTNRLTVGMDRIESDMRNVRPFGYVNDPRGSVSDISWTAEQLTADYVGTFDWRLTESLRTSLSWGGQSVVSREVNLGASGRILPGPGEHTVSSGATFTATESRTRVVNAGLFAQSLFDFKDRYFLTVALRIDGNSAFGDDFGLEQYPRATFSWVTSDEDFWPENLGELKIRAAWGHAGRAPGAFDAVRTWRPISWGGVTSFNPLNVGNPDLGPERTVEFETGFDGSFLDERLRVGFTYYNQETQDALIPVQQTPSLGFGGSQLQNVGVLKNKGIELDVNGTLLRSSQLSWDLGLTVYTNKSEAVDLGGSAGFGVSGGGWIEVGGPVPAVRYDKLMNPNEIAEPIVEVDHVWGPNQPTLTLTPSTTITFGGGYVITARGEYQGGHYIFDRQSSSSAQRGQVTPLCDDAFPRIQNGERNQLTALDRYLCTGQFSAELVYPNDFFRLRELTFQAPVPFQIPGASSATFTVAAQNFLTWKNSDFLAMDPEMAGNEGMSSGLTREIWEHPPPPASFRVSLRVNF